MWSSLTAGLQQQPSAAQFELLAAGMFALVPVATEQDKAAACAPAVQSAQDAICRKARELSDRSQAADQPGWSGLTEAARLFADYTSRPPAEVAESIENVWALSASLAGYIDQDEHARTIPRGSVLPLEIDSLRMLRDLTASIRRWVRSFPTGRILDERSLKTESSRAKIRPAAEFLRSARQAAFLRDDDARVLGLALGVADHDGVFASKARSWAVWTMSNCAIAMLATLGNFARQHGRERIAKASVPSDIAHKIERIVLRNDGAIGELLSYLPGEARGLLQSGLEAIRLGASDGV